MMASQGGGDPETPQQQNRARRSTSTTSMELLMSGGGLWGAGGGNASDLGGEGGPGLLESVIGMGREVLLGPEPAPYEKVMTGQADTTLPAANYGMAAGPEDVEGMEQLPLAAQLAEHGRLSGHLYKMGSNVKKWKRRFFVLQPASLDYYLTDTNGGEIVTAIRSEAELAEIPIVVYSGSPEAARKDPAITDDIQILAKPLNPESLSSVLRKICGDPSSES